jgi:hypothetical protein
MLWLAGIKILIAGTTDFVQRDGRNYKEEQQKSKNQ